MLRLHQVVIVAVGRHQYNFKHGHRNHSKCSENPVFSGWDCSWYCADVL